MAENSLSTSLSSSVVGLSTSTSLFYLEYENKYYPLKSVTEINYQAKVTGNSKPIASTYAGKLVTQRQTTSGGYETNPTVTIEVYLCADSQSASYLMYSWFQECLPVNDGGNGKWAANRRSGSIVVMDADGAGEVLRWNFDRAWPRKYSINGGDVASGDLAIESYEISAENIDKVSQIRSGTGSATGLTSSVNSTNAYTSQPKWG